MTLKEIKAMFQEGQEWIAENTLNPKATGNRTLREVRSTQLIWKTPQCDRSWMNFPKASQVIEARDGFLKFRIKPDEAHTLTLIRA